MSEEETKTFTQDQVNDIVESRLMRERDKHTETINSLTAENGNLKNKISEIEITTLKTDLISKAGLSPEWAQKITGKTESEIQSEVESIKTLVEKSKPEPLGSGTNPVDSKPVTLFTRAQLSKMTAEEINANWENVQKSLKHAGI
jgi:glucan phosphorylase